MKNILRKFPNDPLPPTVKKASGSYIYLEDGTKYLDTTSGWTSYATLGYSHPKIIEAMTKQMSKFSHIDYNVWNNPMLDKLASRIISYLTNDLDQIYFSGTSGSDSVESAMKLSYQIHHDSGKKNKKNFITRIQSFSGATLQGMSVSDLPILKIFDPLMPSNVIRVSQHNPYAECSYDSKSKSCKCGKDSTKCMGLLKNETVNQYVDRNIKEIEDAILKIGPENLCAFVGETQLGSLVGDVPAAKGYWEKIGLLSKKYDFHIILDEVYCGMGRSGKLFNYSWDNVSPDFVCIAKSMTSGHVPISAIVTKSKFQDVIAKGTGRIQIGHTFQGHSVGVAACMALMDVIEKENLLSRVSVKGEYMKKVLQTELGKNPFFKNIRGRGYIFSLEHKCSNNHLFSLQLQKKMKEDYKIIINSKWHRTSFVPPFILSDSEIDLIIEKFIFSFKHISSNWNSYKDKANLGSVSGSMGGVKK